MEPSDPLEGADLSLTEASAVETEQPVATEDAGPASSLDVSEAVQVSNENVESAVTDSGEHTDEAAHIAGGAPDSSETANTDVLAGTNDSQANEYAGAHEEISAQLEEKGEHDENSADQGETAPTDNGEGCNDAHEEQHAEEGGEAGQAEEQPHQHDGAEHEGDKAGKAKETKGNSNRNVPTKLLVSTPR